MMLLAIPFIRVSWTVTRLMSSASYKDEVEDNWTKQTMAIS